MSLRTLTPAELSVTLDAGMLQFADTSQIVAQDCGWIGQQRAEKAARFGLQLEQPGYNLFVLGGPGSGRSSLLFRAMQEVAENSPAAPDLVYLYNFDQPERPLALRLHNGQGSALRIALERFSANVAHDIPHQLHAEGYRLDCERLKKSHRQRIDRAYFELAAFAAARRFALRRDDGRLVFTLLGEDGQAMQEEAVLALSSDQRVALEDAEQELRVEIGKYLEFVRPIEQETENALTLLRRETAEPVVQREIGALREVFASRVLDEAKFAGYLTRLAEDVLSSLDAFTAEADGETVSELLARYRANLVVDNAGLRGAPALRDDDPLFRSLFGGVDYQVENGMLVTNYLHIRPGNLVRAHGGYLMLHLRDVLRDAAVWEKLQRYLRSGRLQIEEPAAAAGQQAAKMLEPEALDVQVKLVLIGSRSDYYDLQEIDPEFVRYFRVKVDFTDHFPADDDMRHAVCVFIAQRCQMLGLPHFAAEAVACLLVDMQREIDDQRRMSSGLGHLGDMLVESAAYCKARGGEQVSAADVELALAERRARHDYPEQALLDAIADGEVMIHAAGAVTGQINGLTQIDLGDYRFGSPVRITARTYAGDEGVINIDREVEMSGPTHDKGVFILQGWLSGAFANQAPLSLTASLVFEQEYHGVEGDSASCAELYAILSALSGLPLAQGIAITGALNQHGEVMPVGGINEKIEGWFRTCSRLGLNGQQGVLIPERNVAHLVLAQEVRDAVAQGHFRIMTMERVEDGIALLTGMEAGAPDAHGDYPEHSVLGRAQQALENFRRACDESGHREHEHHGHGK